MKKFLLIVSICAFVFALQAEEKVTTLGVHPFYKSRNLKPEDLKKIAIDRAGDVKKGFEDAGYGELVFAFLEQIQRADIQTTVIQPGDKLNWMFFKEGKKIKVLKEVVWAGKKSFTAYQFKIFREGTLYTFVVPLMCGNITMQGAESVPSPVCALTVTPDEIERGKPFKVGACGSTNALKTLVSITDNSGRVVKTLELTPENCTANVTLDDPGTYTIAGEGVGAYGMKSQNPCKVELRVIELGAVPLVGPVVPVGTAKGVKGGSGAEGKKAHFFGDIGLSRMVDPTTFLFMRLGYQHRFQGTARLNLLAGPFINLYGNNYGTPIAVDLTLTFHLSKFWLGGGAGAWLVKNDSKVDVVADIGYEIFTSSSVAGSLFFEGRSGVKDFNEKFGDMLRYGIGFRLVF